ncbi:MAG TPA: cyclase family protein [Gammaproteobacteria bacterium]|nr:cyclase family protein [Gammaproteobacteria bacterium]
MSVTQRIGNKTWQILNDRPLDISIPLVFDGKQPSFFAAPPASVTPLQVEGFIGDTQQGSSCNVGHYHLVPHCNGTHTESLGHIVDDAVFIAEVFNSLLVPTTLITITPETRPASDETGHPQASADTGLITAKAIQQALGNWKNKDFRQALVIRTEPNSAAKTQYRYTSDAPPPYFSRQAMALIVSLGVEHLLVDVPSLDYMADNALIAHRTFWQLPVASRNAAQAGRPQCTVTEMIYAANEIPDGYYCLNLQLPPFMADAAPSRPLLFPLEKR